jgi:hypothetical protein
MKWFVVAIIVALLFGCSPREEDFAASLKINDLDGSAVVIAGTPACRKLKDAHTFYAEKASDLTGGRLFLMANMDGRSCAYLEQGSKLHITASVKLDDRMYFRVEIPADRGRWWMPQFWN